MPSQCHVDEACTTFLLLLFHCLLEVIKHLGNHRSKLLHHTLAEVEEGFQHLLQAHTLQEARVPARIEGIEGGLFSQVVRFVHEGSLKGFVELAANPGDQRHAAVHQGTHFAHHTVEGIFNLGNIFV